MLHRLAVLLLIYFFFKTFIYVNYAFSQCAYEDGN